MGKDAVDPADPVALAERVARLEAELDELRTSRASFQALVESVPDFVVRVGPTGVFEYVNRVAPGLTREQVVGHTIFEFTDLAYHTEIRASIERVLATGEPGAYETTGAGADGATVPYFSRIGPIVEHGKVVALTVVATDVSYVKQTARQLAEHQDRIDLAASAANIGYWHWDAAPDVVVWDRTACAHFGVPADEGHTNYAGFLARIHPADRDRIQREVEASIVSGLYPGMQFRTITPTGELRWVMTSGRVERDESGQLRGLHGCLLDVTERRRLEEQLLLAQRLDAVGQLAAGVAHNFNNLLAALIPALELTARRAPESGPLLRDLQGAAHRAADVVRQLTAFAGGSPRGPGQITDAADLARRVAELSRGVLDRAIVLTVIAPERPVLVDVDGGELEQALMNLVLNARDALESVITEGRPARIRIEVTEGTSVDPRVRVTVADTGAGMSEEIRRRAIEPFFTTKPPGRGTGLGLSSAYAMVVARGGELELESLLGAGTTISLVVPAAVARPVAAPAPRPAVGGGGESVLLIDDDHTVRRAITAVLADAGYKVTAHADPREALAAFTANPGAFAVAIIDHSMPGLSGQALLDRMLAVSPTVRGISFSGHDLPMTGARAQLLKPVSIEAMLATVRRVLDAP